MHWKEEMAATSDNAAPNPGERAFAAMARSRTLHVSHKPTEIANQFSESRNPLPALTSSETENLLHAKVKVS